ncbi:MAG: hypothetical protein HRT47_01650 [Candidatus Caenarcaniphilales bacterium]|nr:hypothetical protein [Candidatus Caenarcaniphilales bacterium]
MGNLALVKHNGITASFIDCQTAFLIQQGKSDEDIANTLFLSKRGVERRVIALGKKYKFKKGTSLTRSLAVASFKLTQHFIKSLLAFMGDDKEWIVEELLTEPIRFSWGKIPIPEKLNDRIFGFASVEPTTNDLKVISEKTNLSMDTIRRNRYFLITQLKRMGVDINSDNFMEVCRTIADTYLEQYKIPDEEPR